MSNGMTLSAPQNLGSNTILTAPPSKIYIVMGQVAVPENGHNNIATMYLSTGTGPTPDTLRTVASVQFYKNKNDYITLNSATMPVPINQTCDWTLSMAGDGVTSNPQVFYFEVTFPSGVAPPSSFASGSGANNLAPCINGGAWTAPGDGFLVGYITGNSGITQMIAKIKAPTGSSGNIAAASEIYGTDVYMGSNSFCLPVCSSSVIEVSWQDYQGGGNTAGANAALFWLGFNNTVFQGGYTPLSTGLAYQAANDLFVIGNVASAGPADGNMKMWGSFGPSPEAMTQYVGSSVNWGKNRWLAYNSFLMPVPKGNWYRVDQQVRGGNPTPGATAFMLPVIPR
jgi:hypothetical protein